MDKWEEYGKWRHGETRGKHLRKAELVKLFEEELEIPMETFLNKHVKDDVDMEIFLDAVQYVVEILHRPETE